MFQNSNFQILKMDFFILMILLIAQYGKVDVIKFLQTRASVELFANCDSGWTPLTIAADQGHLDVIKYLELQGAELAAANRVGYTALTAAASEGQLEVIDYLAEKMDVMMPDGQGKKSCWCFIHCKKQDQRSGWSHCNIGDRRLQTRREPVALIPCLKEPKSGHVPWAVTSQCSSAATTTASPKTRMPLKAGLCRSFHGQWQGAAAACFTFSLPSARSHARR